MMYRWMLHVIAIVVIAGSVHAGGSPPETYSDEYQAALLGDPYEHPDPRMFITLGRCEGEETSDGSGLFVPVNLSAVCFAWQGEKRRASIEIADALFGEHVAFAIIWLKASGEPIKTGGYVFYAYECSPFEFGAPPRARGMKISLATTEGPFSCPSPTVPTRGTVTVTLR